MADTSPPPDETERLAALRRYEVLDTAPEQDFDDIAQLAATLLGTPIALVSLVDSGRQWFKARIGTALQGTLRSESFCDHALQRPAEVMVVNDASTDPRFAQLGLVQGTEHIRFYAGAPLLSPEGHALGTLCVLDRAPRSITPTETEALATLSRQVMTQLELRRQRRELQQTVAQRNADLAAQQALQEALAEREQRLRRIAAQVPGVVYQFVLRPDGSSCFSYASEGMHQIYGLSPESVREDASAVFARLHPDDLERIGQSI